MSDAFGENTCFARAEGDSGFSADSIVDDLGLVTSYTVVGSAFLRKA
jgi:hypothetical protein